VHGHFTTATSALGVWRDRQLAAFATGDAPPDTRRLAIGDDQLVEAIETQQLRLMSERGIDLTVFSPRASFMAHHLGDERTSIAWAAICNELVHRVAGLFPGRFAGAAMLPQSPGAAIEGCLPELRRCVGEYGFVAVNLNPDPSGGRWDGPALTDRYWYPLYEELVALDVPAMIHVSTSCLSAVHTTGAYYLGADTTAVMQLIQGDLFADFPTLRLVIPHGGGAIPYHWGRFRGLAQALGRPSLAEHLLRNVYFDTCVYHQAGIDLLTRVIPAANILFGSEMVGAVRGTDPDTDHAFDDTRRYVENTPGLDADTRQLVLDGNARRVYPRLDRALAPHPTT
jgi:4-oxalmesaconate hydratase